jgi:uncharacterized protein (TIGR00255 family)
MAIKSMTGFARESGVTGAHQWAWEIKTVNGRSLEVRLRAPPGFDATAEAARRAVLASLGRGQCQLTLTLARGAGTTNVRVNRDALRALIDALSGLDLPASVQPASLDGLLAVRGVVEVDDDGREAFDEGLHADLVAGASRLVEQLQAARAIEGAALAVILADQLDQMTVLVEAAEACPERQPEAVKARLRQQVQALLDTTQVLDADRLHQEAALLASRADVREEIDRLKAHLAAARDLLVGDGPVGRRLDFLAQEFGRETNTLCSKANVVSLSRIGLDLKAVVEQFREQVQNVE